MRKIKWERNGSCLSIVIMYTEVCGMKGVGGGMRKGSEWWCETVEVA